MLAGTTSTQAATETWNGAGTDWNTSTNWTPNTVPGTSDIAEFNSTFINQPNAGSAETLGAVWTTTGVTQDVTVSGLGSLVLNGTTVNSIAGTAILLDDAANHNLTVNTALSTGTSSTAFIVNNNGTLALNGLVTIGGSSRTLTLGNAATDSYGSTITFTDGIATSGGASLTINTKGTVNLGGAVQNSGLDGLTQGTVNITGSLDPGRYNATGGTTIISGSGSIATTGAGINITGGELLAQNDNAISGVGTTMSVTGNGSAIISGANSSFGGGVKLGAGSYIDGSSITIGNSASLGSGTLTFSGGTLIAATPGLTVANTLVASSNGGIVLGGSNAMTFSGSVIFNSNYRLLNNDSGGATFSGGTIFLQSHSASILGSGNVNVNEAIADSNSGGAAGSITFGSSGTITLTAANTYTGTTTFTGGTTLLDFSASGAPPNDIIAASSPLSALGGTLALQGAGGGASNSQTFASTLMSGGGSTINLKPNGDTTLTLNLGTLTRTASSGATLNFLTIPSTSGDVVTATVLGNGDGTGIIAPSVTVGSGTNLQYAALSGGDIVAYAGASAAPANLAFGSNAGTNYSFSGNQNVSGANSANTLRDTGGGATVTLNSGATLTLNGLMNAGTGALAISGSGTVTIGAGSGTLTGLKQTTELDIASNTQNISIGSVIANNGSTASALVYTGSGTLTLSAVNTYTGGTFLNSGVLNLTNASGLGTGTLTVANGTIEDATASGNLTVANAQKWTGPVTFGGANGHTLDFTGNVSLSPSGNLVSVNLAGSSTDTLQLAGVVSGGSLVVTGSNSTLLLSGASTFSGGVFLDGGTVEVAGTETPGTSGPLGATASGQAALIQFNGGTLEFSATNMFDYSSRFSGASNQAFSINTNGQTVIFATALSSYGGSLTKLGSGTLALSAANTYTGNTTVSQGTLLLKNSGALQDSTLTSGGVVFDSSVTSNAFAFGGLSGSGNIALQNNATTPAAVALTVGVNGADTVYSGVLSGAGSLTKLGSGTLTLSGSAGNSYSGSTSVVSGGLILSNSTNSATGSGALSVGGGATLGGAGIYSGAGFAIGGTSTTPSGRAHVLAGLTSSGSTATTGSLTLLGSGASSISKADLTFNLSVANPGDGTQLNVGATAITFGADVQSTVLSLNLVGAGAIGDGSQYVLIAGTGRTTMGALTTGQYAGLSTFVNSLGQDQILDSGNGGSGNLVLALAAGVPTDWYANGSYLFINNSGGVDDIEVEVVPEPGTWAMMLGGLGLLLFWQRRHRQR
ncbi:MAG: autotransporter-associated beta strand repeat-containing protein [Verrucomicrobiota bacterium]